jgi:hypothetical protein
VDVEGTASATGVPDEEVEACDERTSGPPKRVQLRLLYVDRNKLLLLQLAAVLAGVAAVAEVAGNTFRRNWAIFDQCCIEDFIFFHLFSIPQPLVVRVRFSKTPFHCNCSIAYYFSFRITYWGSPIEEEEACWGDQHF